MRYIVFQFEQGEEKGTEHIQGYMFLANPRGLVGMKKINKRAHWSICKGTPDQNKAYCTKEDTRIPGTEPIELGEFPQKGRRSDIDDMVQAILKGETDELEIAEKFGGTYMRTYKGVQNLIKLAKPKPVPPPFPWEAKEPTVDMAWLYGNAGTGKDYRVQAICATLGYTRYVHDASQGNWFDNYNGEEAIHFKDFKGNHMSYGMFKQFTDPYRSDYFAQAKGVNGGVKITAKYIFVTTDSHPIETWKVLREERNKWDQISRRINKLLRCENHVEGPDCLESGFVEETGWEPPEPKKKQPEVTRVGFDRVV